MHALQLLFVALTLTATSPLAQTSSVVLPGGYANSYGNSSLTYPIAAAQVRYQQVFLGTDLPSRSTTFRSLGLRWEDSQNSAGSGWVELEIVLATTAKSPNTIGGLFLANYDAQSAPVTVLPRSRFQLPDRPPLPPSDPGNFEVQIPFLFPYAWQPAPNRHLLLEVRVYSNSTNSQRPLNYSIDAAIEPNFRSSVVVGTTPTALGGLILRNSGLVVQLQDRTRISASVSPFGKGCLGSGGRAGIVTPRGAAARPSATQTQHGISAGDQRYQQIIDGSELGAQRAFFGHALRRPNASYPSRTQTLEILVSTTTIAPGRISASFAANVTSPQTTVFTKKPVQLPARLPNTDPALFDVRFKWDRPVLWTARPGEHLLFEVRDHGKPTSAAWLVDSERNISNIASVLASPVQSSTGSVRAREGLVLRFEYPGHQGAIPRIEHRGRPVLGQSLEIQLEDALPQTAAILLLGFSDSSWGPARLPLDLGPGGAPGCSLLVRPDFSVPAATDRLGDAALPHGVPKTPTLAGLVWFQQWAVLDLQANALGLSFSAAERVLVGDQ